VYVFLFSLTFLSFPFLSFKSLPFFSLLISIAYSIRHGGQGTRRLKEESVFKWNVEDENIP
jgi:hypothetical protein